jgi:transposase
MRGPLPSFRPEFPSIFLEQAEKLARQRTVPYQLRQRATLVLLLLQQPLVSNSEAVERVQLHLRSVQRWRRRWATGDFSLEDEPGRGRKAVFSPLDHALVKGVACELVAETQQPLSRQSLADITARARKALGKPISRSTVWRMLDTDAIKPWRYQDWIFPRDPHFAEKAGPILDLYAGMWQGQALGPKDHIRSADEKTSIQARLRCHPSVSPAPGRPSRIEHAYERGGALQYLAAWDVRRGYVIGRCEPTTGIEPFGRLVHHVLSEEPFRSAERVVWIVDNGSSHRGETAKARLQQVDSRIMLVHTPVHASWLNQVEIYFSIIQRKVLTPNDFADLEALHLRLALYEELSNQSPTPFQWRFDRTKLTALLVKIAARQMALVDGQLNSLEDAA